MGWEELGPVGDLWLKALSVYLSFPFAPRLLFFWNRIFSGPHHYMAKASNSPLALESFYFF